MKPFVYEVGSTVTCKSDGKKYYIDSAELESYDVSYSITGSKELGSEGFGSAWYSVDDLVYLAPANAKSLILLQNAIDRDEDGEGRTHVLS